MNTNTDLPYNDNQDIAAKRIAHLLTRATQQLDDHTATALQRARSVALEKQSQRDPVFALTTGHSMRWLLPHSASQRVATFILLAAILFGGLSFWRHAHENDLAHLDIAILTDDLPLEVFVD